jgi:dipeptidase E
MKVLAMSSSRVGNGGFLQQAIPMVQDVIGRTPCNIAFVPFASVQRDYELYTAMVRGALAGTPYTVTPVLPENALEVIDSADAIMVGGGNTFKLLHDIYACNIYQAIQQKVAGGTPYIGWSAGANVSGRSISTTNDMPIIQPASFTALGFLPFQLNPHYINQTLENHNGETRDQRLEEFVTLNPTVPVVGLPEGTALHLHNGALHFMGDKDGVLFRYKAKEGPVKSTIAAGANVSFLL